MDAMRIGRRSFVAGTLATLAACGKGDDRRGRDREGRPRPSGNPGGNGASGGLTQKGMNYDVGIAWFPDVDPAAQSRAVWRPEYVRREIDAIADDLHCNAVLVHGSDRDRMMEAARFAADKDMFVWLEPQLPDLDHPRTVAYLADFARSAEDLRRDHPDVGIGLGCELSLFMRGIVPGETWQERYATFLSGELGDYNTPLNAFLSEAATEIRRGFDGQLTYSSGPWEQVDWSVLDVVGVDLYRDTDNAATYEQEVRALDRFGKPVIITEFGSCSYQGANEAGGDAWSVVEQGSDPPIPVDLVRDEQVQADYVDELLTVFEAAGLHGAFVYNFIEPDNAYHPDPHYDLDMVGYGIVKCYPDGHERSYAATGEWDPKAAFATVATHYR